MRVYCNMKVFSTYILNNHDLILRQDTLSSLNKKNPPKVGV